MKQLVTTEWLEKNIDQVKVLDATWCLPNSNRNAEEEFNLNHIKNSIFFDIDKNSNQNTSIPHMLPSTTFGNMARCCSGVPSFSISPAPRTTVLRSGVAASVRPASSNVTARP